jgi:hypothetical protein
MQPISHLEVQAGIFVGNTSGTKPRPGVNDSGIHADVVGLFLSDVGSTKALLDTCNRWILRCGVLRRSGFFLRELIGWDYPALSALVTVISMWILSDPGWRVPLAIPIFGTGMLYAVMLLNGGYICPTSTPAGSEIRSNVTFNFAVMNAWCDMYESCMARMSSDHSEVFRYVMLVSCGVSVALLVIPPSVLLRLLVLLIMLYKCPLVVNLLTARRRPRSEVDRDTQRRELEVYENQRWWLGNWVDKGLSLGGDPIFPWSDISGHKEATKSDCVIPDPTWTWDGLWQVDEKGWEYSSNFGGQFHPTQKPSDFVRRRRWFRACSIKP